VSPPRQASVDGNQATGHTGRPVRFWTVSKFPNYAIVDRPETSPSQVIAILHGKLDLKEILKKRL
jgi:hypothetical protein